MRPELAVRGAELHSAAPSRGGVNSGEQRPYVPPREPHSSVPRWWLVPLPCPWVRTASIRDKGAVPISLLSTFVLFYNPFEVLMREREAIFGPFNWCVALERWEIKHRNGIRKGRRLGL